MWRRGASVEEAETVRPRRCERGASREVLSSHQSKKGLPSKGDPNSFSLLSWSQTGETETQEPTEKKRACKWKFRFSDGHTQSKFTLLRGFPSFFPCVYGDPRANREKESSLPFSCVYGDTRADREKESSLPFSRVF